MKIPKTTSEKLENASTETAKDIDSECVCLYSSVAEMKRENRKIPQIVQYLIIENVEDGIVEIVCNELINPSEISNFFMGFNYEFIGSTNILSHFALYDKEKH
jgi:hypothetical protein